MLREYKSFIYLILENIDYNIDKWYNFLVIGIKMKILEEKDWVGFNGDSDHKETKAILKLWFIYIPLAFESLSFRIS